MSVGHAQLCTAQNWSTGTRTDSTRADCGGVDCSGDLPSEVANK